MAGIETYGGKCPNCTKPMLQKYDSSTTALMFDACPHCGFIYGTVFEEGKGITSISKDNATDIWRQILEHHGETSMEALASRHAAIETGEGIDDFYPSLFDYSGDTDEEIQSRITTLKNLPVEK